ncbi:MAG: NAD(P)/FAD-dependent oxidoreductase [Pikeienuella sp.]
MSERIVIIGTGQGGFQLASSLRQDGSDARITMIGGEPDLPYQRPPLSKAYMKDGDASRLSLRPESFYEASGIELLRGVRATGIDRTKREVSIEGGAPRPYDHLVLATGARNARPPIANIDTPGVHDLRSMADAAALRAAVAEARGALVIGGGFIGLEFAAVARAAGLDVTVIEMAPRLMARVVSPEMSRRFAEKHEAMGARLIFGQPATGVLTAPGGAARGVRLADGREFEGDLVLLASGVLPNVELAAGAGLEVDNGVVVDSLLLTADPAISALGDCAAFPDPRTGRRVRLESVQAATDHARAIARRLTGAPAPYDAAPWFWSDQADWKLQIAGLSGADDETFVRDRGEGGFSVLRFCDDLLTAAETVNAAGEHMAARRLMAAGGVVRRADLEAHDYSLAALLKSGARKP